jgi:DNA-binding transcriptional ArsR family regulator
VTQPDIFASLANPARRRILELLRERPYTVNELASKFRIHRPCVSEHLQSLRLARLVKDERRGRERYYRINPSRLEEVADWLKPFEIYWRKRLRTLSNVLDQQSKGKQR